jgi:ABC-2 type transport system permease protein
MLALLKKEIQSFLSSLIGYIVMVVFLLILNLFLWVFPGDFNILDAGYATINPLFVIAPWVFMFLIPAVTMRLFADEKKSGTIELLLTRPLTDFQIILSKYFAGLILVLFSLLPTLVYYYSVYQLGNPQGNIDSGGMWGSYIGLLFLAASFVSIGLFASSISENQIISFIVAVFFCFIFHTGFDSLSSLDVFQSIQGFLLHLGINEHYISMSRGVIDTRDMLYFLSLIFVFLLFSKLTLESRKWQ